jgi:hypothetical protein
MPESIPHAAWTSANKNDEISYAAYIVSLLNFVSLLGLLSSLYKHPRTTWNDQQRFGLSYMKTSMESPSTDLQRLHAGG